MRMLEIVVDAKQHTPESVYALCLVCSCAPALKAGLAGSPPDRRGESSAGTGRRRQFGPDFSPIVRTKMLACYMLGSNVFQFDADMGAQLFPHGCCLTQVAFGRIEPLAQEFAFPVRERIQVAQDRLIGCPDNGVFD